MGLLKRLVDTEYKELKRLTQKELAERCGIRQSNISRIENGSCSPTVATLQALASGLGKKLDIRFD